ncbi:MAG: hypothetical protein M3Q44_07140 [bacterium]|nr:hypothetical protein [bacterium]
MRKLILFIIALAVIPLITGCTKKEQASQFNGDMVTAQQPPIDSISDSTSSASVVPNSDVIKTTDLYSSTMKDIPITATSTGFIPAEVSLNLGDTARFMLTNSGNYSLFNLKQFDVSYPPIAQEMSMIEFFANTSGTFEFSALNNVTRTTIKGTVIVK